MRKFLSYPLMFLMLFTLGGCQYYNKYIKKGFPVTNEDEVIQLVTNFNVDATDSTDKIQAGREVTVQKASYYVGSATTVQGYNIAEPVITENYIILMDRLGAVHCLDKNSPKTVIWKTVIRQATSEPVNHMSLTVINKKVFVSIGLDFIEALDLATGHVIWRTNITGSARGQIITDKNSLFVLTDENRVYALNQIDGKLLWISNAFITPFKLLSSPAAILYENKLVIALPDRTIMMLSKDNGFVIKQINLSKIIQNYADFLYDITVPPVILPQYQSILVSIYSEDFRAINFSGDIIWELPFYTNFAPVFYKEMMFVTDQNNTLYAIHPNTGKLKWKHKLSSPKTPKYNPFFTEKFFGPVLYKNEILIFSRSGNARRFNPENGYILGNFDTQKGLQSVPVVDNGKIYVYTSERSTLSIFRY